MYDGLMASRWAGGSFVEMANGFNHRAWRVDWCGFTNASPGVREQGTLSTRRVQGPSPEYACTFYGGLYLALCLAFQRGSVREITNTFSWLYFLYMHARTRAPPTDQTPRPSDEGSVPRSRLRFIHTPHSVRSFNVFGSTQCSAAPRARAPRRAPTPLSRLRHAQSVSRLSSPNLAVYGSRGRLGCLGCFNSCCCCDQLLGGGESVHRLVSQH